MSKILIVEDELHLAEGLKYNFESENFIVDILTTAEDALPVFSQYDMMILDLMLPEMDGLDLLQQIRRVDHKYPVLILSAKISEEDLVEGLAAGADDYITKPFSLSELILRVKRILQRRSWYAQSTKNKENYHFGNYRINFSSFEAQTNIGEIKLTPFECYVMKYLIENKERAVSRSELLEKVWGHDREMETRTVDIFIARLRKLFEEKTKNPKYIKSIRGIGYRFEENG